MQMRAKSHRRLRSDIGHTNIERCGIERLETRTLLSGWTTVDTLPPPATGTPEVVSMAADGAGNVYAAGSYNGQSLLRVKASGSSGFVTVATPPSAWFDSVFADAQGDVFISYSGVVLERRAGQQTFAPVPVNVPSGATWLLFGPPAFASDAASDVFAVGMITIVTGTTTSHGITTTTTSSSGTIFEMKAGQTSFTPVYQESNRTFAPFAITLIASGPSAGIYETDGAAATLTVRKSTDGGISWSKVSNLSSPISSLYNLSIASDSSGNGNVYVAGEHDDRVLTGYTYTKVKGQLVETPVYTTYSHWLTEQSSDGGATWTVVDNLLSADFPSVNAIADLNGTVYVVGQSGELSGDGIVRSNVGGSWQTVDNTGASVYQALTIDPVTGTPYAGGITGLNMGASGWSVRSGPPVAPAAATTALATFSTTAIAGSSAQLSPQTGQIAPDSSASTDGSRLTDQLFDKPAKKAHAHGR